LLEVTTHPKIGVRRVVLGAHAEPIAKDISLAADEIVINAEWEKASSAPSKPLSGVYLLRQACPLWRVYPPWRTGTTKKRAAAFHRWFAALLDRPSAD